MKNDHKAVTTRIQIPKNHCDDSLRNATQHQTKTKKDTSKIIIKREAKQHRKPPEHLPWAQKHDLGQNQTQKNPENAHARQRWQQQLRQIADVFTEFHEDFHTPTNTRTSANYIKTQRSRSRCQSSTTPSNINAEMIKNSTRRLKKKALTTTVQRSYRTPRATTTELERHEGQGCIPERRSGLTIELPTHLSDPHLVQTLQPTSLQTTFTHARRQPDR